MRSQLPFLTNACYDFSTSGGGVWFLVWILNNLFLLDELPTTEAPARAPPAKRPPKRISFNVPASQQSCERRKDEDCHDTRGFGTSSSTPKLQRSTLLPPRAVSASPRRTTPGVHAEQCFGWKESLDLLSRKLEPHKDFHQKGILNITMGKHGLSKQNIGSSRFDLAQTATAASQPPPEPPMARWRRLPLGRRRRGRSSHERSGGL